jgi:hypothetical protein
VHSRYGGGLSSWEDESLSMWSKILWHALRRNGWAQLLLYLSNLDIWRFMEYSQAYQWVKREANNGKIVDLGGGYSVFPSFFPKDDYTVVDLSAGACRYQQSHGTNVFSYQYVIIS